MSTPVSRRQFLALSTACAALGGVAGCSGTGTTRAMQGVTAGPPRSGGVLKAAFAGSGATETLHPHTSSLYLDGARNKAIFDKLVDFRSDLTLEPCLATHWESQDNHTNWRITLREATFHNGQPFSAEDVLRTVASIQANPKAVAGTAMSVVDLSQCRAVSPRELLIVTKRPYAETMDVFADYGTQILPGGECDPKGPVGTGPFAVSAFEPGRRTALTRYDQHWRGPAHLEGLEFFIANDEAARLAALSSGAVHFVMDASQTTVREATPGAQQVCTYPNSVHRAFALKCDRPPFNDPRVRLAVKLLVDRDELHRVVMQGQGMIANDIFGRDQEFYAHDLPQRTRDVARAKALLAEAGATGLKVTLDVTDGVAGMKESALALVKQFADGGIDLTVAVIPFENYWTDTKEKSVMSGYGGGAMTIGQHLRSRVIPGSKNNYPKWEDPRMAQWADAVQAASAAERASIYHQMQELHHNEGGHIIWGLGPMYAIAAPHVGGMDTRAPANTLEWARFDTAWLGQ